ncbi:MAG: hypothetical protein ACRDK4_04895 [Solirubrobacteraceae bacterium]
MSLASTEDIDGIVADARLRAYTTPNVGPREQLRQLSAAIDRVDGALPGLVGAVRDLQAAGSMFVAAELAGLVRLVALERDRLLEVRKTIQGAQTG